tara:strand:+ start:17539 stop:18828 length:1290 start_codon:yes stop_codon:yes gene_type:complete
MTQPDQLDNTPFRINLDHQKKRAKELLQGVRRHDDDCIIRLRRHHPRYSTTGTTTQVKLSDAQLVIAREHGLPGWAKLKRHVENMLAARAEIKQPAPIFDGDLKTLHIRCGSDLKDLLVDAGFRGDFLEYSDPVCQGPVPNTPNLIEIRADFLSSYGSDLQRSDTQILEKLIAEKACLEKAAQDYDRVVLWFEHDTYDQLILARILAYFQENRKPRVLELISLNAFPGSVRFIGLGQLPPEAMRLLWRKRQSVTPLQMRLGKRAWDALRDPTPMPLTDLMQATETSALPDLARALHRHLQELPSSFNGLGLTEQLTLEILKDNSQTAGQIFRILALEKDPLPWLGDIMFWSILQAMAQVSDPILRIAENVDSDWPRGRVSITDKGIQLLAGELDWLTFCPPERWLGGIKIRSDQPCWRWDDQVERAIMK